ncbi:hypothetical protein [Roseicyclus amphidinii]|uniref:hypothetical protein n=1 Tax=Roseicyclus amphidinii TaxID=3034232 RepID=UPI0024E0962D|nr:hypothetical protein [Roseicyclus sp. Amp-Y-6]
MPVVKKHSNLVPRALGGAAHPDPHAVAGTLRIATGTVTNAADDSNLSSYRLVDLPSSCYLHPDTFFDVQNWGFAAIRIGTETDVDALVSVLKSAGNQVDPIAKGDANHGKPLWQVLGLAADPGGHIALYAHAIANATGAGEMPFQVHYIHTS